MMATAEFQVLHEQLVIPLLTQATNWMKKPYVKGMYPNPGTLHAWKFVYIERDQNKWDANADNIMKEQDAAVEEQISKLSSVQKQLESQRQTTAKEENQAPHQDGTTKK
jgi:hypothetical protein